MRKSRWAAETEAELATQLCSKVGCSAVTTPSANRALLSFLTRSKQIKILARNSNLGVALFEMFHFVQANEKAVFSPFSQVLQLEMETSSKNGLSRHG